MNLTILEDDKTLSYALYTYFSKKGYSIRIFDNLKDALNAKILDGIYLVDISLPDGEGYEYGKKIVENRKASLIYLTAKDDQKSILKGFESGSDDYLTKPFTFEELSKRIEAIEKRIKPSLYTIGDLSLNTDIALVCFKDEELYLSVQEYRILLLLLMHQDSIVTRDQLNEALNILDHSQEGTLNVAIGRLRKKLDGMVKIEAVIRQGYRITL